MSVIHNSLNLRPASDRPAAPSQEPPAGLLAWVRNCLDEAETVTHRMIEGIFHFLTQTMPLWAIRQLLELALIAVKAARVAATFAVWLALACWPLLLLKHSPGIVCTLLLLSWVALALAGSVWGVLHVRRRRIWQQRGRGGNAIPATVQ